MSYISNRIQRRRQVMRRVQQPPPALGGILSFIIGGTAGSAVADVLGRRTVDDQTACLAQANEATAALDAKWYNIAQNWNPTGNFTPADMNATIAATVKTLADAQIAAMFAPKSAEDAGEMIAQSLDEINDKLKAMAPYAEAVVRAQQTGATVITSPGFKDWVTKSLVVASGAFAVRAMLDCNMTWLYKAQDYMDQVWAVVSKVVDVVIKVGETAVDVVGDTMDAYKYLKWGALALGAFWIITKVKKSANA